MTSPIPLRERLAAYLHFDGMTWPNPDDPNGVAWRLTYSTPSREDLLFAASVMAAYAQLVRDTQRVRNGKIARIRELADAIDKELNQ